MRKMLFVKLIAILLSANISNDDQSGFPPPEGNAVEAAHLLRSARSTSNSDELRSIVEQASNLLAPQSPGGEKLRQALSDRKDDQNLLQTAEEVLEMLSFEPLKEAELPDGFPTYTPAGSIELKVYPKHRRAIANQFFTLFGHITSNQIAMTTPVRMEFENNDGKLRQESMSFYYGKPTIGTVGTQGRVEVVEESSETVLSLGHQGTRTSEITRDGERRLLSWLAANPKYEVAGKLIVMGYNSPMVPVDKQFWEIQIPIKEKTEN